MPIPRHAGSRAPKPVRSARRAPEMLISLSSRRTSALGFKMGGDARGAEGMATDPRPCTELSGAALDDAPGVDAVHGFVRQRAGAADGGAEEGVLPPPRIPAASI